MRVLCGRLEWVVVVERSDMRIRAKTNVNNAQLRSLERTHLDLTVHVHSDALRL